MLDYLFSLVGLKQRWPLLSAEETRDHNDGESLWIISGNSVYDITEILLYHPGGAEALLRRAGGLQDCRSDYDFHSYYARRHWNSFKIGEITDEQKAYLLLSSASEHENVEGITEVERTSFDELSAVCCEEDLGSQL